MLSRGSSFGLAGLLSFNDDNDWLDLSVLITPDYAARQVLYIFTLGYPTPMATDVRLAAIAVAETAAAVCGGRIRPLLVLLASIDPAVTAAAAAAAGAWSELGFIALRLEAGASTIGSLHTDQPIAQALKVATC